MTTVSAPVAASARLRHSSPELVELNTQIVVLNGHICCARVAADPKAYAARIRRQCMRAGMKAPKRITLPWSYNRFSAPGTAERLTAELAELEAKRDAMHAQASLPENVIPFRSAGTPPRRPATALAHAA